MRWCDDPDFANNVARTSLSAYTRLQKKGKPQANKEWTLLAAVLVAVETGDDYKLKTVAIGTGSKCIGKSKMSEKGDVLNDSHAEVLARRAFICYLMGELEVVYGGGTSDVLSRPSAPGGRCLVRDSITFHFYTSHTPCGDASIFLKDDRDLAGLDPTDHDLDLQHGSVVQGQAERSATTTQCSANLSMAPCIGQADHNVAVASRGKCTSDTGYYDSNINLKLGDAPDASELNAFDGLDNPVTDTAAGTGTGIPSDCRTVTDCVHAGVPRHGVTDCVHAAGSSCMCDQGHSQQRKRRHSDSVGHSLLKIDRECDHSVISKQFPVVSDVLTEDKLKHADASTDVESGDQLRVSSNPTMGQDAQQCDPKSKRKKTAQPTSDARCDIYRTGAKCVVGGMQDPHGDHEAYHVTGAFRIKPGRGERTLSMSCSDKLARWNVVGCQGALLCHVLARPVYLQTVTVGRCPVSVEALQRAVVDRSTAVRGRLPGHFTVFQPRFYEASIPFPFSKETLMAQCVAGSSPGKIVPAPAGVAWFVSKDTDVHDVTVNGQRQGVTAKNIGKPEARSAVCSKELFRRFLELKLGISPEHLPLTLRDTLRTYKEFKLAATDYQNAWQQLLGTFAIWQHKPPGYRDFDGSV